MRQMSAMEGVANASRAVGRAAFAPKTTGPQKGPVPESRPNG